MATLQSQFQLTPNLTQSLPQLGGALGQFRQLRQQKQQQAELGKLRQTAVGLGGATPTEQKEARLQLLSDDPERAKKFFEAFDALPKPEQDKARETNKKTSIAAASTLNLPDDQLQSGLIAQAQQLQASGFNQAAERAAQLAQQNLPPEELRLQLQAAASQTRDIEKVIVQGLKRQDRLANQSASDLKADLKASKDKFDQTDKLRSRVDATSKQFKLVRDAKSRVDAVFELDADSIADFTKKARENNPRLSDITGNVQAFGDMALIFNFMKMLDPGSTVREGEFASASNTAGISDRVLNLYNKALSGQRLTPEQRQGIKANVNSQFKSAVKNNERDLVKFRKSAKAFDLDPTQIFDLVEPAQPAETNKPTILKFDAQGNPI